MSHHYSHCSATTKTCRSISSILRAVIDDVTLVSTAPWCLLHKVRSVVVVAKSTIFLGEMAMSLISVSRQEENLWLQSFFYGNTMTGLDSCADHLISHYLTCYATVLCISNCVLSLVSCSSSIAAAALAPASSTDAFLLVVLLVLGLHPVHTHTPHRYMRVRRRHTKTQPRSLDPCDWLIEDIHIYLYWRLESWLMMTSHLCTLHPAPRCVLHKDRNFSCWPAGCIVVSVSLYLSVHDGTLTMCYVHCEIEHI